MSITNDQVGQKVEEMVFELIDDFQIAPYTFLYESDLQATLFAKLRAALPELVLIPGAGNPLQKYKLAIVHTEYWKRVDVACIDVELASKIPLRLHCGSDIHIYEVPLLYGIELKYRKMGDRFDISSCLSDHAKLQGLNIEHSLVLGFVQNEAYMAKFLLKIPGYRYIKVSGTKTLGSINVIGPNSRWVIEGPNAA
jgi:hypothetical protein